MSLCRSRSRYLFAEKRRSDEESRPLVPLSRGTTGPVFSDAFDSLLYAAQTWNAEEISEVPKSVFTFMVQRPCHTATKHIELLMEIPRTFTKYLKKWIQEIAGDSQ